LGHLLPRTGVEFYTVKLGHAVAPAPWGLSVMIDNAYASCALHHPKRSRVIIATLINLSSGAITADLRIRYF
jgi:hypothetical protein